MQNIGSVPRNLLFGRRGATPARDRSEAHAREPTVTRSRFRYTRPRSARCTTKLRRWLSKDLFGYASEYGFRPEEGYRMQSCALPNYYER